MSLFLCAMDAFGNIILNPYPDLGLSRSRYGPFIFKSRPAHFANPIVKNYYSVISYCGDLIDKSAKRLGRLMKHEMERGLKD